MTEFSSRQLFITVILLGILSMLGPVGHDIFIPSIPNIANGLNTTTNLVSVSISAIFLGNAIGTLFHGPLSDRFGRKPVILWILGIYAISATSAALSPNVETLIFFRFFQGVALSGGRVLSAAVARDLFDKERLGKVMSDIMSVAAIAAVIAPIVGGFTAKYLPWQSSLVFMAIFGGLVFILFAFMFKEQNTTGQENTLRLTVLFKNIATITTNYTFQMYSLCGGFMLAGLILFLSVSANIIIESYGVSAESYGFMFATISLCYLIGTFIGSKMVTRLGLNRIVAWGVILGLIGGTTMLAMALMAIRTPTAIIFPMGIFIFGLAFVNPSTVAGALQPFPGIAGTASSLTSFVRGIMGAAVSFSASLFRHDDAFAMATTIFLLACMAAIFYRFGIQNEFKRTE